MKITKKEIALLILNLFVFVNTVIITINGVIKGPSEGQVGENMTGINYFKPYTIDSNVLLAIASLLMITFLLIKVAKKNDLPSWLIKFYYVATTSIVLTFLTVIAFLFPTIWINEGFNKAASLFLKDMFFFHVSNPIVAVISLFLLRKEKLTFIDNFIAVIPMFIYSIVYVTNVAILNNWTDFYGFTFGGKNYLIPIVLITMYGVIYLIGLVFRNTYNKIGNKK